MKRQKTPRLPRTSGFAVLLLAATLAVNVGTSRAQEASGAQESGASEPIEPDRPGFTNGSGTVEPRRVIAENGITRTREKRSNGGGVTTDYPETLLRIGVTSRLEAQIGLPCYFAVRGSENGFGDGLLGLKYKFYESRDGNTRASLAPAVTLPLGSRDFGSPHVDPVLTLGADRQLGSRANFAVNLVLSDPSESGDASGGGRNFTVTPAAALSYSLSPKLGAYVDAYAILPRHGASASVVDGGFTYLLSKNVQLDLEAGTGVGGDGPARFFGGGVSFGF